MIISVTVVVVVRVSRSWLSGFGVIADVGPWQATANKLPICCVLQANSASYSQ